MSKTKKEKRANRKKRSGLKIGLIVTLVVIICLAVGTVAAAAVSAQRISESDRNLPNVYVANIYVGDMTQEETLRTLKEAGWNHTVSGTLTVSLPAGTGFKVDYLQSGASRTAEELTRMAHAYGHDGTPLENLFVYLGSLVHNEDVNKAEKHLNEEYIRRQINAGIERFRKVTSNDEYRLDEIKGVLVFVKGGGRMTVDENALYEQVIQALSRRDTDLKVTLSDEGLTMPDFSALFQQLYSEPADAYYDKENDCVIDDVKGISFEVKEAQALWKAAEPADLVEVPVTVTIPEMTSAKLKELLFRDQLGTKTTYYWGSTQNRINNIDLVAEKLDGLILMPGEEFSYNGYVGQRTEEAGFKVAGAYDNGQVVQEIGGGICQVSSTLYYSVLAANLEVLERTCHWFLVTYLDKGLDATVSWPDPDFRFRNNRDFPIMIKANSDHQTSSVTIEIWGSNIDGTYVIPGSTYWKIYDTTYPDVQVAWGASSWRDLYDANGNLIERIDEARSKYYLHDEDIKWPEEEEDEPAASEEPVTAEEPVAVEETTIVTGE